MDCFHAGLQARILFLRTRVILDDISIALLTPRKNEYIYDVDDMANLAQIRRDKLRDTLEISKCYEELGDINRRDYYLRRANY